MDLEGILNISGKPGLYKVLKTTPRSFIVESLDEKKKRFSVSAASRVAALSEISIYTLEDQEALSEVFLKMHAGKDQHMLPEVKAADHEIRAYFYKILPDHDDERVYVNDIRKLIKWYRLLEDRIDSAQDEEE